jgi:hypothetical protein
MDEKRARVARELVSWHFKVEPNLQTVYVLLGRADEPIRLIEVNDATVHTDQFEAYVFAPTRDVPFSTAIAEVTPEDLKRLMQTPGALPPEWRLEQAERFERPEAA